MIRLVDAIQKNRNVSKDICIQPGVRLTVPVGDLKLKGTVCYLDTSMQYHCNDWVPCTVGIYLSLTDISVVRGDDNENR